MTVTKIRTPADLAEFADRHMLRADWHEPDEVTVDARVIGDHLDNAMGPRIDGNCGELNVVLTYDGDDEAVVNLADLLAWASRSGRGTR